MSACEIVSQCGGKFLLKKGLEISSNRLYAPPTFEKFSGEKSCVLSTGLDGKFGFSQREREKERESLCLSSLLKYTCSIFLFNEFRIYKLLTLQ